MKITHALGLATVVLIAAVGAVAVFLLAGGTPFEPLAGFRVGGWQFLWR